MSYLKRSITPIFNFKFEEDDLAFTFSGNYNDSDYSITLKQLGSMSLAEINKLENNNSDWSLPLKCGFEIFFIPQKSIYWKGFTARHFLIINVQHRVSSPITDIELEFYKESPCSTQLYYITNTFLQSLQLHTTNGISFEKIYSFRIPYQKLEHFQSDYNLPNIRLLEDEELSILKQNNVEKCRKTFLELLIKRDSPNSTYKHLLFLALRYHQITFNLKDLSHKFLILMIIFEALFKKENERNAENAAIRISKFVSKVQSNREQIFNDFYNSGPASFCRIRNQIAHGDPNLNMELIKTRYPLLYKYITKAIIKYASIPSGAINTNNDFYSEIDNYINIYYNSLPSS